MIVHLENQGHRFCIYDNKIFINKNFNISLVSINSKGTARIREDGYVYLSLFELKEYLYEDRR